MENITLKFEEHCEILRMIADLRLSNENFIDSVYKLKREINELNEQCDDLRQERGRIERREAENIRDLHAQINRQQHALKRLREGDTPSSLTYEEQQLWLDGKRIQAIKEVRARTNLGLSEAKKLCEDEMGPMY